MDYPFWPFYQPQGATFVPLQIAPDFSLRGVALRVFAQPLRKMSQGISHIPPRARMRISYEVSRFTWAQGMMVAVAQQLPLSPAR
jgi:hypothetical protein